MRLMAGAAITAFHWFMQDRQATLGLDLAMTDKTLARLGSSQVQATYHAMVQMTCLAVIFQDRLVYYALF